MEYIVEKIGMSRTITVPSKPVTLLRVLDAKVCEVNEGTAITINDSIEQAGNYDAAMSEISGFNSSQRLKAEASVYRKNANTALATGALDTAAQAGNGYNSYKNGWK